MHHGLVPPATGYDLAFRRSRAAAICSKTRCQSPGQLWRNRRTFGYQGLSGRSSSQPANNSAAGAVCADTSARLAMERPDGFGTQRSCVGLVTAMPTAASAAERFNRSTAKGCTGCISVCCSVVRSRGGPINRGPNPSTLGARAGAIEPARLGSIGRSFRTRQPPSSRERS